MVTPSPIRPLNSADRFLLAVDRTIRRLGGPGFETQTFLWLDGRINASKLAAGIAALSQHFPVLTARLIEPGGPFWQIRPGATAGLHEALLPSADSQAVLDYAARCLSAPTDPADVDPVRFHLLHRPDGRDVFMAQYNHALLDHNDAIFVLQQLNRLSSDEGLPASMSNHTSATTARQDRVWTYLRKFPKERRRATCLMAENCRQTLRGGALTLGRTPLVPEPYSYGIIARRLEPAATAALQSHLIQTCGVPSLSMGVLACALRAIGRLAESAPGRYLHTGIGVDLGLNRGGMPAMQNLTTLVPLRVDRDKLGNREQLSRRLSQHFREQLSSGMDLGVLELATVYGRQQSRGRWATELLLRYCISLWYGSFGALRLGPTFYGMRLDEAFSTGPPWSPVGLTLLVNQFAGRLHLQVTYIPECVPEPTAKAFLDTLIADLPTTTPIP